MNGNLKLQLVNSGIMSFLISGFMTIYIIWINIGFVDDFIFRWLQAWSTAFPVAFLCVIILAPIVNKITTHIFKK